MNIGKPPAAAMGLRPACSRIIYDYTHLRAKWLHSPRSFIVLGRARRPLVPFLTLSPPLLFPPSFLLGGSQISREEETLPRGGDAHLFHLFVLIRVHTLAVVPAEGIHSDPITPTVPQISMLEPKSIRIRPALLPLLSQSLSRSNFVLYS